MSQSPPPLGQQQQATYAQGDEENQYTARLLEITSRTMVHRDLEKVLGVVNGVLPRVPGVALAVMQHHLAAEEGTTAASRSTSTNTTKRSNDW